MFEFGRELKRLFGADAVNAPRDGLTGGDASLLELLDLRMIAEEGRAADIAAGRVGAKDKAQRRLESAIVWREVARRSGDAAVLRKAAATAEAAAEAFDRERRPDGWARARCEQAFCAMLGAELFGDDGLNAAADVAFREARAAARGGLSLPLADIGIAAIEAREQMASGAARAARAASDLAPDDGALQAALGLVLGADPAGGDVRSASLVGDHPQVEQLQQRGVAAGQSVAGGVQRLCAEQTLQLSTELEHAKAPITSRRLNTGRPRKVQTGHSKAGAEFVNKWLTRSLWLTITKQNVFGASRALAPNLLNGC